MLCATELRIPSLSRSISTFKASISDVSGSAASSFHKASLKELDAAGPKRKDATSTAAAHTDADDAMDVYLAEEDEQQEPGSGIYAGADSAGNDKRTEWPAASPTKWFAQEQVVAKANRGFDKLFEKVKS